MNRSGKLHALLSTARVANIPSVVSNVWVGMMIGFNRSESAAATSMPASGLYLLLLAGVFLYVSGNFLNDWADRDWDASRRPERALPRRLFPFAVYAFVATLLAFSGVIMAFLVNVRSGWIAEGIAFWIVIYTLLHKRTPWAVIPMGLCRALLPAMGCVAVFPHAATYWPACAALFTYIAGLSLCARNESIPEPPRSGTILSRGLLFGAALLACWGNFDAEIPWGIYLTSAVPFLVWTGLCLTAWRKPVPRLVSRLLAGIPLVDWITLLPYSLMLSLNPPPGSSAAPMILAIWFVVSPLAVVSALALQRLAPAT